VRPIGEQYREKVTTFLQRYEAFITELGNEGTTLFGHKEYPDQALLSDTTARRNALESPKVASGLPAAQPCAGTIVNISIR